MPHRVELVLHVLAVQLPADRPALLVQLLVERHQADLQGDVVVLGEDAGRLVGMLIHVLHAQRMGQEHPAGELRVLSGEVVVHADLAARPMPILSIRVLADHDPARLLVLGHGAPRVAAGEGVQFAGCHREVGVRVAHRIVLVLLDVVRDPQLVGPLHPVHRVGGVPARGDFFADQVLRLLDVEAAHEVLRAARVVLRRDEERRADLYRAQRRRPAGVGHIHPAGAHGLGDLSVSGDLHLHPQCLEDAGVLSDTGRRHVVAVVIPQVDRVVGVLLGKGLQVVLGDHGRHRIVLLVGGGRQAARSEDADQGHQGKSAETEFFVHVQLQLRL